MWCSKCRKKNRPHKLPVQLNHLMLNRPLEYKRLKGSSETDEPWKLPGESLQQPEQKGPPKRKVDRGHGGDKAQTTRSIKDYSEAKRPEIR